jgi:hypothetical protein
MPLSSSNGWNATPLSTSFPLAAALHVVPKGCGAAIVTDVRAAKLAAAGWLAEAAARDGETLRIISI